MAKKSNLSAADRIGALLPEVLLPQDNHARPYVENSGIECKRIDLMGTGKSYLTPAYHYYATLQPTHTLCGKEIAKYKRCEMGMPVGTCASCRVEASIKRAVVA